MIYALDLGGSTIDVCVFDESASSIVRLDSVDTVLFPEKDISALCEHFVITGRIAKAGLLRITGGRSGSMPKNMILGGNNIVLKHVSEFEAIAKGLGYLSGADNALAVSLGTGTAMVSYRGDRWEHVKGTGLGGGSFIGLSRAMLGCDDFWSISRLAQHGDAAHINLSISDIVGGDLGMLPSDATAANFAKYSVELPQGDIALGIAMMIAESVTALAVEKAMRCGHGVIVVGGKFSLLPIVEQCMNQASEIFSVETSFPENRGFMAAIGACLSGY